MGLLKDFAGLFRKSVHDRDDIVQEEWEIDFSKPRKGRFVPDRGDGYSSQWQEDALCLELHKTHLFAWINDPVYRYNDVVLEGEIEFSDRNGYCASGFIFRYVSDDYYYYFLVSNRGHYRFDVVFNGSPIVLIDWTPCSLPAEGPVPLRIVCRDDSFTLSVDDNVVAEIVDDKIDAGGIAFAGQNFGEKEECSFRLVHFLIDSLPLHVEAQHIRWRSVFPMSADSRAELAKTWSRSGHYLPAAQQMEIAGAERPLSVEENLLYLTCLIALEMYEEALTVTERVLEKESDNRDAVIARADILYSLNRLLEMRELVREALERFPDNALLWNLLGNSEYALGNYDEAGDAYSRACSGDEDVAQYSINAARSFERCGKTAEAAGMYVRTAEVLFHQEGYDEVLPLLDHIFELDPDNCEARGLQAKLLFHEGRMEDAYDLFTTLISEGAEDASYNFLLALIISARGDREAALPWLKKAAELEPGFYLYWFKWAENLYFLGEECSEELEKAAQLAPEDPWVNNLSGLVAMESDSFAEAEKAFRTALKYEKQEVQVFVNLAEALYRQERIDEALAVLDEYGQDDHAVRNQRGNMLAALGDMEGAADEYEQGLLYEPGNMDLLQNAASVYMEMDMYGRAEDLLRKALELEPSAANYNLMGNLASLMVQLERAEKAYQQALGLEPDNHLVRGNYVDLLINRRMYNEARDLLEQDSALAATPRGQGQLEKIRDHLEVTIRCASCSREWSVPRDAEYGDELRIVGEPPGESPAGKCPACGKVYCIECAKAHLVDNRFVCPGCREYLKLSDDYLRYLVARYISNQQT